MSLTSINSHLSGLIVQCVLLVLLLLVSSTSTKSSLGLNFSSKNLISNVSILSNTSMLGTVVSMGGSFLATLAGTIGSLLHRRGVEPNNLIGGDLIGGIMGEDQIERPEQSLLKEIGILVALHLVLGPPITIVLMQVLGLTSLLTTKDVIANLLPVLVGDLTLVLIQILRPTVRLTSKDVLISLVSVLITGLILILNFSNRSNS